uniref:Putative secreted protein n=1 Tax=Ixodes ricinus TaxID=34613 RepID=A0A6B0UE47_IXORI
MQAPAGPLPLALAVAVVAEAPYGGLEVGGDLLLQLVGQGVDLETIQPGHKLAGGPLGPVLGMHHKQHVGEACAEVSSVRVMVPRRLGQVYVHALGAVRLHHRLSRNI